MFLDLLSVTMFCLANSLSLLLRVLVSPKSAGLPSDPSLVLRRLLKIQAFAAGVR